jgi:hypothetical protein
MHRVLHCDQGDAAFLHGTFKNALSISRMSIVHAAHRLLIA